MPNFNVTVFLTHPDLSGIDFDAIRAAVVDTEWAVTQMYSDELMLSSVVEGTITGNVEADVTPKIVELLKLDAKHLEPQQLDSGVWYLAASVLANNPDTDYGDDSQLDWEPYDSFPEETEPEKQDWTIYDEWPESVSGPEHDWTHYNI